jgi:hypothetical protein
MDKHRILTLELIKSEFRELGIEVLSESFVSSKTKLHLKCSQGHEWFVTYDSFIHTKKLCPYCSGRKHTLEDVKNKVEAEGYELISDTYKNAKDKIKLKCPEGHEWETSFRTFDTLKCRCIYCAGQAKHEYDDVKDRIENERGFELISTEYINANTPLTVRCKNEHEWKVSYSGLFGKSRLGCPHCSHRAKHTYEEVKERIAEKGFELLSTEYTGANNKILLRCSNGHEWESSYSCIVRRNTGCPYCKGTIKKTYEEIYEAFKSKGYKLLSLDYVNSQTKLQYQCPNHPDRELWISYGNLHSGHGCPYCVRKHSDITYEEVKLAFEERGYILLSTEYKNCDTKLHYQCPSHLDKNLWVDYYHFQRGQGCPYCIGRGVLTYEEVKLAFEERGYILISEEYINKQTKLQYQCPNHPDKELWIDYSHLQERGQGCPYCSGVGDVTYADAKLAFEKRGYKLISTEFINNQTKLQYQCPNHPDKELWMNYGNLQSGRSCPYCSKTAVWTYEEIKEYFEITDGRGYKLISVEQPKDTHDKLQYQCPNHPDKELWILRANLQKGRGCPYCAIEARSGDKSIFYNDGRTTLFLALRSKIAYKYENKIAWVKEKMQRDNYTCQISGQIGGKLNVHHFYNFSGIVEKVLLELGFEYKPSKRRIDFTEDEFNLIASRVIEEHTRVDGITLSKVIHILFHKIYGKKLNTPKQIEEFKQRYQAGEFDEYLNKSI